MAELPDLTVFVQILSRRFKGKVLYTLEVSVAKQLNVTGKELKAALEGKKFLKVSRGRQDPSTAFFRQTSTWSSPDVTGKLSSFENDEPPRFQILGFHFKGGQGFAITVMQKQATPTLNRKKQMPRTHWKLLNDILCPSWPKKKCL